MRKRIRRPCSRTGEYRQDGDDLRAKNNVESWCLGERRQEEMAYGTRAAAVASLGLSSRMGVMGCNGILTVKVGGFHNAYRHEGKQ